MKKKIFLLLFLFNGFSAVFAQKIHYLLFANTLDLSIGKSCQVDNQNVLSEIKRMSKALNMPLGYAYSFEGNSFRIDSLESALQKLQCEADDMLIFHFAGHGGQSTNKYPTLQFWGEEKETFLQIVERLRQKNPRFLLALADCCNDEQSTPRSVGFKEWTGTTRGSGNENQIKQNYQKLFGSLKGEIIASGASPKESAYGDPEKGGLFSAALINEIQYQLSQSLNPDWAEIMERVRNKTITAAFSNKKTQTPQYEGMINGVRFSSDQAKKQGNLPLQSGINWLMGKDLLKIMNDLSDSKIDFEKRKQLKDQLLASFKPLTGNQVNLKVIRSGILEYRKHEEYLRELLTARPTKIVIHEVKIEQEKITKLEISQFDE